MQQISAPIIRAMTDGTPLTSGAAAAGSAASATMGDVFAQLLAQMADGDIAVGQQPAQDPGLPVEGNVDGLTGQALLDAALAAGMQGENALEQLLEQLTGGQMQELFTLTVSTMDPSQKGQKDDQLDESELSNLLMLASAMLQQPQFTAQPGQLEELQQAAAALQGIVQPGSAAETAMQQVMAATAALSQPEQETAPAQAEVDARRATALAGSETAGAEGTDTQQTVSTAKPADQKTGDQPAAQSEVPVVSAQQTQEAGQTRMDDKQAYDLQTQFRNAVQEAKRQLGGRAQAKLPEIDVDALQSQIMANRGAMPLSFSQFVQAAKPAHTMEPEPLAEQVRSGMQLNLAAGKNEFTLKLNPENLGEITVRMTETDGKTTMHLITASVETARMLNSDLSALREAVKPMQVEVHEAVAQAQENPSADLHQSFDMAGQQQFSDRSWQEQRGAHHSQSSFGGMFDPAEEEPQTAEVQQTPAAALDAYV